MQHCQPSCQSWCAAWQTPTWLQVGNANTPADQQHEPHFECVQHSNAQTDNHTGCARLGRRLRLGFAGFLQGPHLNPPCLPTAVHIFHPNPVPTCRCSWPAGQLEEAEVALREVLGFDLPLPERLPVLARLAEVQLQEDSLETQAKVAAKLAEKIKEAGGDTSKVGGWVCMCVLGGGGALCVHCLGLCPHGATTRMRSTAAGSSACPRPCAVQAVPQTAPCSLSVSLNTLTADPAGL